MTTMINALRPGMNGLSHLVEAATALTALVDSSTQAMATTVSTPAVVSEDDESRKRKSDTKATTKKREIFPEKLIEILSDSSLSEIISWLPHGRSFVIIRPDIFTQQVLPKYLPPVDARASTKYPSFTRKLNRWYVRISENIAKEYISLTAMFSGAFDKRPVAQTLGHFITPSFGVTSLISV